MPVIKDRLGETEIYIEVDDERPDPYADIKHLDRDPVESRPVFRALEVIRASAPELATNLRDLAETVRPDECEVKFGVKLNTQMGAIFAKSSAGAQLEVRLLWKNNASE